MGHCSVIQLDTDYCFICGKYGTEIHHIFYGAGNRKISDQYGMTVGLCYNHHRGNNGVHGGNRELDVYLKQTAQKRFIELYSESEYFALIGKNYL